MPQCFLYCNFCISLWNVNVRMIFFAEIFVYGDSNVLKNSSKCDEIATKIIPTFTFHELMQKLQYKKHEGIVIIHDGTNDVRDIFQKYYMSEAAKLVECERLAKKLSDFMEKLSNENPNALFMISKILPRFDSEKLRNAGDLINSVISDKLKDIPNIFLIYNDHLDNVKYFQNDGYHLTSFAFSKLLQKWSFCITSFTG